MKQHLALAIVALVLAAVVLGAALAQPFPEHPHLFVQHLEFDVIEGTLHVVGWKSCKFLAAGQALPLNSQHANLHFGTAGEALFTRAGHAVVPAQPFPVPWANCEELAGFLPIPLE